MAKVIDTRNSDGAFVVLGDYLVLPNSTYSSSSVFLGSLRYNPTTGDVEFYNSSGWQTIGYTGGGSGLTFIDLIGDASGSTTNGTLNVTLVSVTTAGTFSNITVDVKGRVTSARALDSADVSTALGFTPANIVSPTFSGTPTAPTPSSNDVSTRLATTAFVQSVFASGRTIASGAVNLHVSSTGSDANNGSSGSPFATVTHAYNTFVNKYDMRGFAPTINIADGTYNESISLSGTILGAQNNFCNVTGDISNPGNVVFSANGSAINVLNGASITAGGMQLASSNGDGIFLQNNATSSFNNLIFGNCPNGWHIQGGGTGSYITTNSAYTISGSALGHVLVGGASEFVFLDSTICTAHLASSGTITFSQGFVVSLNCATVDTSPGAQFIIGSGVTITGYKAVAKYNGIVLTNGVNLLGTGNSTSYGGIVV